MIARGLFEIQAHEHERRLRRVPISNQFVLMILRGDFQRGIVSIATDLPTDAEVVHVVADMTTDCIVAFVRSSEFDVVEDGREIPLFYPKYTVTAPEVEGTLPGGEYLR